MKRPAQSVNLVFGKSEHSVDLVAPTIQGKEAQPRDGSLRAAFEHKADIADIAVDDQGHFTPAIDKFAPDKFTILEARTVNLDPAVFECLVFDRSHIFLSAFSSEGGNPRD